MIKKQMPTKVRNLRHTMSELTQKHVNVAVLTIAKLNVPIIYVMTGTLTDGVYSR